MNLVTAEPTLVTRPDDLVARHARIDRGQHIVPLVTSVVKVGVADAAEENLDLHVAFGRVAAGNRGGGQRRGRAGGGVGFGLVHKWMFLLVWFRSVAVLPSMSKRRVGRLSTLPRWAALSLCQASLSIEQASSLFPENVRILPRSKL